MRPTCQCFAHLNWHCLQPRESSKTCDRIPYLIKNYLYSHNIYIYIYIINVIYELLRRLFTCLFVRLIVCSIGCSALFSCALLRFALLPCTRSPPKGTTSPIPRHRSKFTHPTHPTANDPTPHYNFAYTQQSNCA